MTLANAFTFLRVALVPVFAALLLIGEPRPGVAVAVFVFAAATDGLDGWVARRLDQVTGAGQFLDPLADKLLVGTALVTLALAHKVAWWVVIVILVREIAVSLLRVRLARAGRALPASKGGKLKTVTQMVAVVIVTVTESGSPLAVAVVALAVLATVWSGAVYFLDARRGKAGVEWK